MHFFNRWWRHIIYPPWTLQTSLHSPYLLLHLNPLNCLQSQSNFHTLTCNIYRPPQSTTKSRHSVSFSLFLEYFQTLISSVSTSPHEFLIISDFNIRADDLVDSDAILFLSLLDYANLTQHVLFPTHRHSHTLDLVITSANSTLSPTHSSLPILPTDHFPIIFSLKITN